MKRRFALVALAMPVAAAAQHQVGHLPGDSPYQDVPTDTRIGAFTGWYAAGKDRAGVLPKSGPIYGVTWDVHIGGPADLAFRVATVPTKRNVLDPIKPLADRVTATRNLRLGMADAGILFNLTGNKSWHGILPYAHGNVGIITDFSGQDAGGYVHGTTFAIGYGLGARMVRPGGRFAIRADVGSYFYSITYPPSYYTLASDSTSVLPATAARSGWHNNWALTLGVTWAPFR